jgi:hypothetical protein
VFRIRQYTRPRGAICHGHRIGKGPAQQAALIVGIGATKCRSKPADTLAIRLDQSDIHPIQRCAAHEANRSQHRAFLV